MIDELSADRVRNICDPNQLGLQTTRDCPPLEGIIGQKRAVQALQFGLEIPERGFNIYVAGLPGTGKTTAVVSFLEERARSRPVPPDWVYLNNFKDPYQPNALKLPAGRGRTFQREVRAFVDRAKSGLQQAFENEEYEARKAEVQTDTGKRRDTLFQGMADKAKEAGFLFQVTPMGMVIAALKDGKPVDAKAFAELEPEVREDLEAKRETLQDELKEVIKEAHKLDKTAQERTEEMDREVALYALGHLMEDLLESYSDIPVITAYLKEMHEDILENIGLFRSNPDEKKDPRLEALLGEGAAFRKYEVNVIVDNHGREGAPVIFERNPTYPNLFGRIEKEAQFGALQTDFTMIRGGSIHRANGGYLVIPVLEMLRNLYAWDGLKGAVRNGEVVIEELGERLGHITTRGLRPEPSPLEVKVVLIGNPMYYQILYNQDEDFNELFKVKADFDTRMDRSEENIRDYLAFVCTLCEKEGLRQLDSRGAAKVIEFGSRQADDQEKLSTHFRSVADLIREANFWAGRDGQDEVGAPHVQKAIEEKVYRSNLIQERIQEMIRRGSLLIDTSGQAPGQINGLAVLNVGDYHFGRPSRITASIGLGRGGIVDIEREAKLGGPIHTKGVLILSGYLVQQYAQDKPLSLSARLVFEQSYEGVEGDSASCAELYALLSARSHLSIRQGIAVTGSVNQNGDVQAIGGVNEKIEGFFEVCKAAGLSGEQGVLIPDSNVQNLMLKEEVVEAIRAGKFHVWPVQTIDEGIEVLTGVPAGVRGTDGTYPEESVHGRVIGRLDELAKRMKSFAQDESPEKRSEEN